MVGEVLSKGEFSAVADGSLKSLQDSNAILRQQLTAIREIDNAEIDNMYERIGAITNSECFF